MSHTLVGLDNEATRRKRSAPSDLVDIEPITRDERTFVNMLTAVMPRDAAGRAAMKSIMRAIVAASISMNSSDTITPS